MQWFRITLSLYISLVYKFHIYQGWRHLCLQIKNEFANSNLGNELDCHIGLLAVTIRANFNLTRNKGWNLHDILRDPEHEILRTCWANVTLCASSWNTVIKWKKNDLKMRLQKVYKVNFDNNNCVLVQSSYLAAIAC